MRYQQKIDNWISCRKEIPIYSPLRKRIFFIEKESQYSLWQESIIIMKLEAASQSWRHRRMLPWNPYMTECCLYWKRAKLFHGYLTGRKLWNIFGKYHACWRGRQSMNSWVCCDGINGDVYLSETKLKQVKKLVQKTGRLIMKINKSLMFWRMWKSG